jgi:malate dehydrogenase (quinone)
MLGLLDRVFPTHVASDEWQATLTEIIPSYGQKLAENPELLSEVRAYTARTLALDEPMNLSNEADAADESNQAADEASQEEPSAIEDSATEDENTTEA